MKLKGANGAADVEGLDLLPGKSNYLIGRDPKRWRIGVPEYARVRFRDVYPGVDLLYYGTQQQLEYDLVLNAGADPAAITFAFEGADHVRIDATGDLVLTTAAGEIRQHKPIVYQEPNGHRETIAARYELRGKNEVGFEIGAYDRSRQLVIDPVIVYSTTIFGGSTIAVDSAGNVYITGGTDGTNFITTRGAFQGTHGSGTCGNPPQTFPCADAFVTKLNSTGTALVYSTYLGGSGTDVGKRY